MNALSKSLIATASLFSVSVSHAALISHYEFDGDLTDSVGSNDLTETTPAAGNAGSDISFGNGYVTIAADTANSTTEDSNFLKSSGFGTVSPDTDFTVSYWFRWDKSKNTSNFSGPIFATEASSVEDWQVSTLSSGSSFDFRDVGGNQLNWSTGDYSDTDTWYFIAVQSSGATMTISMGAEGADNLTVVGSQGTNSGNDWELGEFLFGQNRAKNANVTFDLANAKIFDDNLQSISALYAEGSMVPEPSSYALLSGLLALATIMLRRR